MQIAAKPRVTAGITLLGLLMAIALMTAPAASAAEPISCKGHAGLGTVTDDYDNPVDYVFACTGRLLGYMVMSSREMDAFDTEIEVVNTAKEVIASDSFFCEGDFPGNAQSCFGTYGANGIVSSTISLNEQKPCQEPRTSLLLVVVPEALDATTGAPKKTSNGVTAGPFVLGRPRGCPKSSILGGLLAEIALVRAELRPGA